MKLLLFWLSIFLHLAALCLVCISVFDMLTGSRWIAYGEFFAALVVWVVACVIGAVVQSGEKDEDL